MGARNHMLRFNSVWTGTDIADAKVVAMLIRPGVSKETARTHKALHRG